MLEVNSVRAGYGVINVLWDVSIQVARGEVTAIVGPNGAGKTTLLRTIMGLLPLQRGQVVFDGEPISALSTWSLPERGIVMVPEGRMIFRDMSIEENLMMGAFPKSKRAAA